MTRASIPPLLVHAQDPLNAEPPLDLLCAEFITPERHFYIRDHGNIPRIDAAHHALHICGRVSNQLRLSMAELRRRFAWRTVVATLQCAGNRRAELDRVRPVSGDKWQPGAIGTAEWGGIALSDVLGTAGLASNTGLHVAFTGLDAAQFEHGHSQFGASIPIEKALAPEVLLALEMNGRPLPIEHGAPLRALVPGYAGVRSVKWLAAIEVRDRPSDNHFQQREYKLFPPEVSEQTADWDAAPAINEMPLNAVICQPADGALLPPGPVRLRGYAFAYGGTLDRVELSGDGGRSWADARLERRDDAPWAWALWHADLDLLPGPHMFVVRAWDKAGHTQPATPAEAWNFKGYLCASWHRIGATVGS